MAHSLRKLIISTLTIATFSKTYFSIITVGMTKLSIMALNNVVLGIVTVNITTISKKYSVIFKSLS